MIFEEYLEEDLHIFIILSFDINSSVPSTLRALF